MRVIGRWLAVVLLFACLTAGAAERPLTVFAAASLKESLDQVGSAWAAAGHPKPLISYAASSALARQIEQGAPADVFVSADAQWMDYLQDRKLIVAASRFVLVRNELVVVAPANAPLQSLDLSGKDALTAALGNGRLAVAETASVPAGIYAKQSLTALGLWEAVAGNLAQGDNVRATLAFVARGDTPLGIVYATDAKVEPRVKVVAVFPPKSHAPIVYPAARTTTAFDDRTAADFLTFLRSRQATGIFRAAGFGDGR